jgi:hypothetical protein
MRITDSGESADESTGGYVKKPSIYDSIKTQSRVTESVDNHTGEISKVTADVQSTKLKQLLGKIKQT